MLRHSYREHDYTFGQAMLTLRTSLGLAQAGLAALLGGLPLCGQAIAKLTPWKIGW